MASERAIVHMSCFFYVRKKQPLHDLVVLSDAALARKHQLHSHFVRYGHKP